SAGAARAHPQGYGQRDPPTGDSHPGGQNPPTGGRPGAGADLRAGLSGLLVWLPAGAVGAPGVTSLVAADDGPGWLLVGGSGPPEVLRYSGARATAGPSSAAGT